MDNKVKAFETANILAKNLSSREYMSTQTTAYALYAMSKFAIKNGEKGVNVAVNFGGKSENLATKKSVIDKKLEVKKGKYSVSIKNNTDEIQLVGVENWVL